MSNETTSVELDPNELQDQLHKLITQFDELRGRL
jgi:hypothetical protein